MGRIVFICLTSSVFVYYSDFDNATKLMLFMSLCAFIAVFRSDSISTKFVSFFCSPIGLVIKMSYFWCVFFLLNHKQYSFHLCHLIETTSSFICVRKIGSMFSEKKKFVFLLPMRGRRRQRRHMVFLCSTIQIKWKQMNRKRKKNRGIIVV